MNTLRDSLTRGRATLRVWHATTLAGVTAVAVLAPARADEPPAPPPSAPPVASVCPDPGAEPAKPTCQRYVSSKVVKGGKVQTVQTPVAACNDDPGWAAADTWVKERDAARACETSLCSGKGTWAICSSQPPASVTCARGRVQAVSCVGVLPPGMALIPADGSQASFYMDKTEVTVSAYDACVSAGACTKPGTDEGCNEGVSGRGNHPINCVDWDQATKYCASVGKRLPTEEEWQYAAQGPDGREYPWGNAAPSNQLCWDGEGSTLGKGNRESTCAVGSFPSGNSPFGLSDMSGNVWEWTSSKEGGARVNRGGGGASGIPSRVRAANRNWSAPSDRSNNLGFRCSR